MGLGFRFAGHSSAVGDPIFYFFGVKFEALAEAQIRNAGVLYPLIYSHGVYAEATRHLGAG